MNDTTNFGPRKARKGRRVLRVAEYSEGEKHEGIDYDGNRVKGTIGTSTTYYVGNYFEWTGSTSTMKKYYYVGGVRVAMRTGSSNSLWLLGDHLGSTSKVANFDGLSVHSQQLYKPWGEGRYASGTLPTTYKFTGQREEQSLGLYFYNARFYDPALGRFVSPDSIIPAQQGVMGNDRYAAMNNNPLRYVDPSGHSVDCALGEDDCEEINGVDPEPPPIELPDAPPDFDNPTTEGNPLPPNIPGLPDDEWEWGDWPGLGEGYKNREDPWGTVYRPDKGLPYKPGDKWGEQPHWNARRPGQPGRSVEFPPNPRWGRPGQRPGPGDFNPGKGIYEIVLITVGAYVGWQIISNFGFGGGGGGILLGNMVR